MRIFDIYVFLKFEKRNNVKMKIIYLFNFSNKLLQQEIEIKDDMNDWLSISKREREGRVE